MKYNSSTRTFTTTLMCPPTTIYYHFVIERTQPITAADQPMAAPAPASTQSNANRWKLKSYPPALDKAVFPSNELLALRNYVHLAHECGGREPAQQTPLKMMRPRQPREVLKKSSKKKSKQGEWSLATSVFKGMHDYFFWF